MLSRSSFREPQPFAGVKTTKRQHLQLLEISKTTKCSISYCCESIIVKAPVRNRKKTLSQDKWVFIASLL